MPYFTQRLVDDFASHLRLYRRARDKVKVPPNDGKITMLVYDDHSVHTTTPPVCLLSTLTFTITFEL